MAVLSNFIRKQREVHSQNKKRDGPSLSRDFVERRLSLALFYPRKLYGKLLNEIVNKFNIFVNFMLQDFKLDT